MSQGQPRGPRADQLQEDQEPIIKYGDVFNVSGALASQPVAPMDAAAMQAAENMVLGHTQKGGPAAVMESAAAVNERLRKVGHGDAQKVAKEQGVTVSERIVDGTRVIIEAIGRQVLDRDAITVGEALEATAPSVLDKPVDQGDAAASHTSG